jgi:hypothetical protein
LLKGGAPDEEMLFDPHGVNQHKLDAYYNDVTVVEVS